MKFEERKRMELYIRTASSRAFISKRMRGKRQGGTICITEETNPVFEIPPMVFLQNASIMRGSMRIA
jgi:hypothetical protein